MKDNILDLINGKYHTAIITTFNFDINFFDAKVVPKLEFNNIKNILLFVDANEFEKSIKFISNSYAGKKYNVIPVKISSTFHPKLILLLGNDQAKLIIGSFNQTRSGYLTNQEIYNCFEYDKSEHFNNLNIIQSAMGFINNLFLDNNGKDEIINQLSDIYYLKVNSIAKDKFFLSSYDRSIIEQVKELIDGEVKSIDIAVPFYDNELKAIKGLNEIFKGSNIRLFVQNGKSTFPIEYNEKHNIISNIFKFDKIRFNDSNNFYHGKVIRFNTDKKSYVLYGSTNCTLAALFKSLKNGGNIECDILAKGNLSDYENFFKEFKESDKKEFTKYEEEKEEYARKEYCVLSIELKGTLIEIYLQYTVKPKKILLNNEDISFSLENNLIKIEIAKNQVDTIFDLIVVSNNEFKIRCFYNDFTKIEEYRHNEKNKYSIPEHLLNKDNIMLSDLIDIINCLPLDKEQIDENKEIEKAYRLKKAENESDDLTEEFEIDNEKLMEYAKKYNENVKIKKIVSHISDSYFRTLINDKLRTKPKIHNNLNLNLNTSDVKIIDIEEYNDSQCKKLITKLIEKLLFPNFINSLDYKSYKDYIGITLSYLDKYQQIFKSKNLLTLQEIYESKYNVLISLLEKNYNNELTIEEEKSIIIAVFSLIFEIVIYGSNNEKNSKNQELKIKRILNDLSKYSSIKEYNEELKQSLIIIRNKGLDISEMGAKKIIDDNIGYLNIENIKKAIEELIVGVTKIIFNETKIIAIIETKEINKGLELKTSSRMDKVIRLIKLYSLNVSPILEFDILIANIGEGNIQRIEYLNNISTLKAKRITYYKNGKVNDKELNYSINFYR